MPTAAPRVCSHPGCNALTTTGSRCPAHQGKAKRTAYDRKRDRLYDSRRGSSAARGYDADWRWLRGMKLSVAPLCEDCRARGQRTPAIEVHHIKPVDDAPELRLEWSNLVSVCRACHLRRHGDLDRQRAANPAAPPRVTL